MKKILVAVDSFKGSMSSIEAGYAIKRGIERVIPDSEIRVRPVADGGEGTISALIFNRDNIRTEMCKVMGPLGADAEMVNARYVTYECREGKTAIIEMAEAAGLTLVPENKRNPMTTTTYGVGQMIIDAINKGCRHFIIGIGGSATNDGGVGMLQALGFRFADIYGKSIPFGAEGLGNVASIYDDGVIPGLRHCTFRVACDVTNPLLGVYGCTHVFAPQKGADEIMVESMEKSMENYADVVERFSSSTFDRNTPGAGAAGGVGYAFLMFLDGTLESGIDIVISETGIENDIVWSDTVITGEGRIDSQTIQGKTPAGIAHLANRHGRYVIAIGGCTGAGAERCIQEGLFNECYCVCDVLNIEPSDQTMEKRNAIANLEECTKRVISCREKLSLRMCSPAKLL